MCPDRDHKGLQRSRFTLQARSGKSFSTSIFKQPLIDQLLFIPLTNLHTYIKPLRLVAKPSQPLPSSSSTPNHVKQLLTRSAYHGANARCGALLAKRLRLLAIGMQKVPQSVYDGNLYRDIDCRGRTTAIAHARLDCKRLGEYHADSVNDETVEEVADN